MSQILARVERSHAFVMNRLCHCGTVIRPECVQDMDPVSLDHRGRCCNCFDAWVAAEAKFCAECAAV